MSYHVWLEVGLALEDLEDEADERAERSGLDLAVTCDARVRRSGARSIADKSPNTATELLD